MNSFVVAAADSGPGRAEGARAKLHGTIAAAMPSLGFLEILQGVLKMSAYVTGNEK